MAITQENDDRKRRRREYKRRWQAQWRLEHPQEAKEQAQKDWYRRSCRMAEIRLRGRSKVIHYNPEGDSHDGFI